MAATRLISHTFLAATAAAAATLVPATATAAPPPNHEFSFVDLSVRQDHGDPRLRGALLTCNPTGGTHPKADAACTSLTKANGDFGALRSEDATSACTLEYQPVTVTAKGKWNNKPVQYTKVYSNACVLKKQTGDVFAF